MRSTAIVPSIVCFVLLIISNLGVADSAAIRTMAEITMNLNHYASDSDKQKLAAITNSGDSSKSEVAVATAILNIEHRVAAADKEKLNSLIGDDSTPAELRELARILININHRPTESDIDKLEELVAGRSG